MRRAVGDIEKQRLSFEEKGADACGSETRGDAICRFLKKAPQKLLNNMYAEHRVFKG